MPSSEMVEPTVNPKAYGGVVVASPFANLAPASNGEPHMVPASRRLRPWGGSRSSARARPPLLGGAHPLYARPAKYVYGSEGPPNE